MSDFLNSFLSAWEDEPSASPEPDDSRAPNVNVLLRKARGRLQGTVSDEELLREIEALEAITVRSFETLEGLDRLGERLNPAREHLQDFADLLAELADWAQAPDEDQFEGLRQRFIACGESMLATQAELALESRQAKSAAPQLQEDAVPVSPEVSRLYRLTQELVASGPREPWEECLAGLQASFRKALAQARATRGAPVEELQAGLETVLAGLDELAGYPADCDTLRLDEGWATLLEGFRMLQAATAAAS